MVWSSVHGSSYGALAALYASIVMPRRISRLLLESPPLFMFGERLTREASQTRWPSLVYVGVGTKDTSDEVISTKGLDAITRFVAAARKDGARVLLNRIEGASHNSTAWRSRFPAAMRFLYGALPSDNTGNRQTG